MRAGQLRDGMIVIIVEVSDGQGKVDTFVVPDAGTGREAENAVRRRLADEGFTPRQLSDCYFETMRREIVLTHPRREATNEAQDHPLVNALRQPKAGDRVLTGTIRNPEYDTIDEVVRKVDDATWLVDLSDADSVRIMYGDAGWAVLPALPE